MFNMDFYIWYWLSPNLQCNRFLGALHTLRLAIQALELQDVHTYITSVQTERAWGVNDPYTAPGPDMIHVTHKVLTYVESRAVSVVFQNIDPPPPLHPASVSSPRTKGGGGGVHTRRAVRGWGVNILEAARHWIGLLQYNLSTMSPHGWLLSSSRSLVHTILPSYWSILVSNSLIGPNYPTLLLVRASLLLSYWSIIVSSLASTFISPANCHVSQNTSTYIYPPHSLAISLFHSYWSISRWFSTLPIGLHFVNSPLS